MSEIPQTYGIANWGEGYFFIDARGRVAVRPDRRGKHGVALRELVPELRARGVRLPVLVRFTGILRDRVVSLCEAFRRGAANMNYRAAHTAVYPIKVNQQRTVIESIRDACERGVGLEAGSKPELIAVMALAAPGSVVVCNGYKDAEYMRLASIARAMGLRAYVVIEKPSELPLVLREAEELGVEPLLGVRVRLAASARGNWQNSGGEKSKFGLSAAQLFGLREQLVLAGKLDCLQLLHAHIGSQIPNLADIQRGVTELARFYAELRAQGVPLRVVDIGGGLGVDYEGTRTRHFCSINYSLESYASSVMRALLDVCRTRDLPHPEIFTESGRAMTAHHAVLIADVIDREVVSPLGELGIADEGGAPAIDALVELYREMDQRSPIEVFHLAEQLRDEAFEQFSQGTLDLAQRARAERCFLAIGQRLMTVLRLSSSSQRALLDDLRERMADKLFCNFSVFQSMPDVWAIAQIFPVMPLQRLRETPTRAAIIEDLTCDSDGMIGQYVDQDGVENILPVHDIAPGEEYLLGVFLLGAYQEILGDMHNLFGDTDAVNVELDADGGYRITEIERGDRIDELLAYVHFDIETMRATLEARARATVGDPERASRMLGVLFDGLAGHSYLTVDQRGK